MLNFPEEIFDSVPSGTAVQDVFSDDIVVDMGIPVKVKHNAVPNKQHCSLGVLVRVFHMSPVFVFTTDPSALGN